MLFAGLSLKDTLGPSLMEMAQNCFRWICRRQQAKATKWHDRLIMLKNTAYAWRQLIFYLSMLPTEQAQKFLPFAREHLGKQGEHFQQRFGAVLRGLELAFDGVFHEKEDARRFLGWSKDKHWLLD